jgi:5-methylcytosine-specific restriction enzyme subunit McrC
LDHIGPSHELGGREMLPFLVNMNHLYERFVARWLKENIPLNFDLKIQEKIDITEDGSLFFRIDIVIYDINTKAVIAVLDTKYKTPDTPDKSDINQAIAYAEVKGCQVAVLIYPEPLKYPINKKFGRIRVFTMTFSLSGDLDFSGKTFLNNLGLLSLQQFQNQ